MAVFLVGSLLTCDKPRCNCHMLLSQVFEISPVSHRFVTCFWTSSACFSGRGRLTKPLKLFKKPDLGTNIRFSHVVYFLRRQNVTSIWVVMIKILTIHTLMWSSLSPQNATKSHNFRRFLHKNIVFCLKNCLIHSCHWVCPHFLVKMTKLFCKIVC